MGLRPDGMRSIPERKRSFRHQLRLGWLRPPGHCSARRSPSIGKRTGITPIHRWDAEGRRSHHRRPASGSFTAIRMMPKGPGSDRRKARVPCCLRRTMLIVRLTHPGNRMDRDDSGRPGARGIHAGFRPRHRPHPEVSGRLSTAQRRTPPPFLRAEHLRVAPARKNPHQKETLRPSGRCGFLVSPVPTALQSKLSQKRRGQSKTTVRLPCTKTRSSRCKRSPRASASRSQMRPLRRRSAAVSR